MVGRFARNLTNHYKSNKYLFERFVLICVISVRQDIPFKFVLIFFYSLKFSFIKIPSP